MKFLEKKEVLNTAHDEQYFRLSLQNKVDNLKSKKVLEDINIDSIGIIHCFPSGITTKKGVHVLAKLNFVSEIKGEKLIKIEYFISPTQRILIVLTVVFQCLFISLLLMLFYLKVFSIESFFFKMLIALPLALILTIWLMFASFYEQISKISNLLKSLV